MEDTVCVRCRTISILLLSVACSNCSKVIVTAIVALDFCRNYGCSLLAQYEAVDYGCQQVLWLYGEDHQITEAGTMNIFLHWINEDGG